METAKIVVGSHFGDEGKGSMTDYFAHEAKEQNSRKIKNFKDIKNIFKKSEKSEEK